MMSSATWYRLPLSAILPERPTYFTGSVLGPSAERALRAAYEQFGAPLAGGPAVWDIQARRAGLNDALLQPADAALRRSLADSGGGLSRLLGGSSSKRATATITQTLQDAPDVIARIERWWTRVRAMEWRQATVLQIMEELEPRAEDALLAQARVALEFWRRRCICRPARSARLRWNSPPGSTTRCQRRAMRLRCAAWLPAYRTPTRPQPRVTGLRGRPRCASRWTTF